MRCPLFSWEKLTISSEVKTVCLWKGEGISPFVIIVACLLTNLIVDLLILLFILIGGNVNEVVPLPLTIGVEVCNPT